MEANLIHPVMIFLNSYKSLEVYILTRQGTYFLVLHECAQVQQHIKTGRLFIKSIMPLTHDSFLNVEILLQVLKKSLSS